MDFTHSTALRQAKLLLHFSSAHLKTLRENFSHHIQVQQYCESFVLNWRLNSKGVTFACVRDVNYSFVLFDSCLPFLFIHFIAMVRQHLPRTFYSLAVSAQAKRFWAWMKERLNEWKFNGVKIYHFIRKFTGQVELTLSACDCLASALCFLVLARFCSFKRTCRP